MDVRAISDYLCVNCGIDDMNTLSESIKLKSPLHNRKWKWNSYEEMSWSHNIKGVLLDITGVLYESGACEAIKGSVDAVEK